MEEGGHLFLLQALPPVSIVTAFKSSFQPWDLLINYELHTFLYKQEEGLTCAETRVLKMSNVRIINRGAGRCWGAEMRRTLRNAWGLDTSGSQSVAVYSC